MGECCAPFTTSWRLIRGQAWYSHRITAADLERFNLYYPFVKQVVRSITEAQFRILHEVVQTVGKSPSIFPQAKQLRIRGEFFQEDLDLLPPSLQSLEIHFYRKINYDLKAHRERGIEWGLFSLPIGPLPNLTSLAILSSQPDPLYAFVCPSLIFLLHHHQTLTTLRLIVPIELHNFSGVGPLIAGMPNLQTLGIGCGWLEEADFGKGYSALTDLELSGTSPIFLDSIETDELQSLHVLVNIPGIAAYETSSFRRFKDLTKLTVTVASRRSHGYTAPDAFLNCSEIRDFNLKMRYTDPCDWSVANLRSIIQAWRQLRSLIIEELYPSTPLIKLPDLEFLGECCPFLERLALTVDAQGMEQRTVVYPGQGLRDLSLGWSLGDSRVGLIAAFIRDMWPNQEIVSTLWRDEEEQARYPDHYLQLDTWTHVWRLVSKGSPEADADLSTITAHLFPDVKPPFGFYPSSDLSVY